MLYNGSSINKVLYNGHYIEKCMLNGKILFEKYNYNNLLGIEGNFQNDVNSDGVGDGWSFSGVVSSSSVFNNIQTYIPKSSVNFSNIKPSVIGHKYYTSAYFKTLNNVRIYLDDNYGSEAVKNSIDFAFISKIATAASSTIKINCWTITNTGDPISVKQWLTVDLTASFGEGNEPDQNWCDANLTFTTD